MTRNLLRAGALSCALLATTCLTTPASAAEPAFRNLDANGVDLTHGDYRLTFTEASAGSGETGLDLVRAGSGRNNFTTWDRLTFLRQNAGGTTEFVTVGNSVTWDNYSGAPGNLSPLVPNGSSVGGADAYFAHRSADGTLTEFTDPSQQSGGASNFCTSTTPIGANCVLLPTSITQPDGRAVSLEWELHSVGSGQTFPPDYHHYYRLSRVSNSFGYAVEFTYANNSPTSNQAPPSDWYTRTGATLSGNGGSIGTVSYAEVSGAVQVTDMAGRAWRIAGNPASVSAIRRPGESNDSISITTGSNTVTVVRDGVTTNYSRSVSGSTATMTVTDAASEQTVIVSDMTIGRPTSVTDPENQVTSYQYDSYGRLTRITRPEGNYAQFTLDGRGNVTQTQFVPKSGSGLSTITTSATFPSSCSNPACNRPTSITDGRNNTTDFTYDSTHGGVLTVTGPAVGGVRPQTRYSYTLTNGEYRLTGVSACQAGTAPSCVGTSDEARTVIAYDSSGNVCSTERRIGNTLVSMTSMTYTAAGDVATVDGPLAGTADTTRFRYNAARQLVGTISPDPDGGSSLKHRAQRITYATNALPTKIEIGTVNGATDTDWTNFSRLEEVQTGYDTSLRPNIRRLVSGGTTYALTQTSYNSRGMVECVAVRMNPSEFGSLPSSACTLDTEGSYGPDRITYTTYTDAGQIEDVTTGYLTSAAATESMTYRNNGQVETVTDGNGNRTTFVYDGHDRLSRTRFPEPSTINTSSNTDYEELGYDANGNVTSRRLRDGGTNVINYTYDALNRLTEKDLPGSEPTVTFGYDLLSRLTSASSSAQSLTFTFDALGRNLTQVSPLGTTSFQYNDADQRTNLTYPGSGLVIGYTYNTVGEMTEIRENPSGGNTLLATYAYDDRGRRTSLTRGTGGSGRVTTYDYDPVSRLDQIVHDLNGSSNDLTLDFTHNPALQIHTNIRSNDSYAYTGHANVSRTDTHNGLNQVTATGATSVTYGTPPTRGNVIGIGNDSYGYSSENMLTSGPNSAALSYDPLLRLYQASDASSTTRFAFDGQRMIAEYNGSDALQRRFVHGPGVDEPIVWYEGSGTSDRRWYHADERGSIIAVSDGSGNLVGNLRRYDEYGNPQGTLDGRFGYTGQAWLSGIGMWYYRARVYNSTLSRFMQTDPIFYESGLNLYAYVNGDPVNLVDPLGLSWCVSSDDAPDQEYCFGTEMNSLLVRFGVGLGDEPNMLINGSDLIGDGASLLQLAATQIDRCAARVTPPLDGRQLFYVRIPQLQGIAQVKFLQHSWPLRADGRPQSVFGGRLTSAEDVANAAMMLISSRSAVPAGALNLRITGDLGFVTGRDHLSMSPTTTYLTAVVGPPTGTQNGLPVRPVVSIYAGC